MPRGRGVGCASPQCSSRRKQQGRLEDLERLGRLRDSGVLSQEEFEREKALLG